MPLMLWMPHDDLAALIELLPTNTAERGGLMAAIRGLDLAEAAQWREMGTYPGDFAPEVVAGRATPGPQPRRSCTPRADLKGHDSPTALKSNEGGGRVPHNSHTIGWTFAWPAIRSMKAGAFTPTIPRQPN